MKKIFTLDETKKYVKELEKKIDSIERSHSYRVGVALIEFYKLPWYKKIKNLKKLFIELKSAFKKKVYSKNIHTEIRVYWDQNTSSANNISLNVLDKMNFMQTEIKYQDVILSFQSDSNANDTQVNMTITPNNFKQLIQFSNADRLIIDTNQIHSNMLWKDFGTYEESYLTMLFFKVLSTNKTIEKVLIHNNDITMYPLILKHIDCFNEVKINS